MLKMILVAIAMVLAAVGCSTKEMASCECVPGYICDELGECVEETVPDASLPDAQLADAALPDASIPDATLPDAEVALGVEILRPEPLTMEMSEAGVELRAIVSGPDIEGASYTWESLVDGTVASGTVGADGSIADTAMLTAGVQWVEVTVTTLSGVEVSDRVNGIRICGWRLITDFSAALTPDWELFGDASRDAGGWLELTGNARGRQGAIYYTASRISPGDVDFRFRISTGGGSRPGADGFAMSVFAATDATELRRLVAGAPSGSGLGYAVGGAYSRYGMFTGSAFHVEFDTYYNRYNGTNELHTDPSSQPHVEITLNGDAANSVAYANVADLGDNDWHEVEIQVDGERVRVTYDGREIINQVVPGLAFQGGYIGFSGSTGYYTNFHRFDDLAIREGCAG